MSFADPERVVEQLLLTEGMTVADFGAGAGFLAVRAAERVGKSGKVFVVDIQKELLTKATNLAKQHHLDTLVFVHADLESEAGTGLQGASLDVVIVSNLLFQVEHPDRVIKEAFRILQKGGRMLVVDWRGSFSSMGPEPQHVFPEDETKAMALAAGFSFLNDIDAGSYHYGLVFRK